MMWFNLEIIWLVLLSQSYARPSLDRSQYVMLIFPKYNILLNPEKRTAWEEIFDVGDDILYDQHYVFTKNVYQNLRGIQDNFLAVDSP